MKVFLDSSSFAKRFIKEKGSEAIDDILAKASALGLSVICVPEVISALNRKAREKTLSTYDYALAKQRLSDDISDADIVQLTPGVISRATTLLESNPLRAMDALHVACAIEWRADIFISSDRIQIQAAKKARLKWRFV